MHSFFAGDISFGVCVRAKWGGRKWAATQRRGPIGVADDGNDKLGLPLYS